MHGEGFKRGDCGEGVAYCAPQGDACSRQTLRKCLLEGEAATLCGEGLGSRPALLSTLTPLSLSK